MSRRSVRSWVGGLAALSGAVVLVGAGGDPASALADDWSALRFAMLVPSALVVGLIPGWFAMALVPTLSAWARVALAVLVSALLAFGLGTAALVVHIPLVWAARALAAVALGGGVAGFLMPSTGRAEDGGAGAARERLGRSSVLFVSGWVALVAALYAINPELRSRVDGWFHAAVAAHVAQVGVPPDDPWYARLPLHYPWAHHVVLDVTVAAAPAGANAFDALAAWAVLIALAVAASVIAAGRSWASASGDPARAHAAGAWAFAIAAFGLHPLGFWHWLARGVLGHDRGIGPLLAPLGQGAGATLQALSWALPHPSLAFFADKILTPTALGLAYVAAVTALDALFLAALPAGARSACATIAILAALVFHPLAGASLVLALVVAAAVALARGDRRIVSAIAWPCAAALLFAAPYLALVLIGRASSAGPWLSFSPAMVWAVVVTGAITLLFAWPEARRAFATPEPPRAGARDDFRVAGRRSWIVVAAVWLVASVFLAMVQRNETKFLSLGLLALAIPAGACAARHAGRAAVALAIALPTSVVAVLGFALDAGQEALGARRPEPAAAAGYAWIAASTRAGDVFLEPEPVGTRDPVRDLLVHGPRALVWGGRSYASNWGYPALELAMRQRAAEELAAGDLSAATVRDLERRFVTRSSALYAVERAVGTAAPRPLAKPGSWTRVYAGQAFALDRLDTAPAGPRP